MTAETRAGIPATFAVAGAIVAAVVVFWPTLVSVFGAATTPVASATAGALVAALAGVPAALAAIVRGGPPAHPKLEPAMLGALPFVAGATLLVLLGPARLGFEYWIWRMDVLAFVFLAVGLLILAVGTRAVVRHGALAVILVAIPPLLLPVARLGSSPLTDSIRWAADKFVAALPLGVRPDDGRFLNAAGEAVSIGEVCSGLDAAGMVAALVLVLAVVGSGPAWKKLAMAATAGALLWIANLIRTVILLAIHGAGADALFGLAHATSGLVALMMVALGTVLAARRLGVRFEVEGIAGRRIQYTRTHQVAGSTVAVVALAACTLGVQASADEGLSGPAVVDPVELRYDESAAAGGAGSVESTRHLALEVPGWQVRFDADYPWFGTLFGPGADAGSFTLGKDGEPPVWVQAISSRSLRKLDRFGPVECFVAHGWTPVRVMRVELPGGAGMLAEHRRGTDERVSALSWTQPAVLPDSSDGYVRFVVMSDAIRGDDQDVATADGALDRAAFGLMNLLSVAEERDPGEWAYGPSNRRVMSVGHALLGQ